MNTVPVYLIIGFLESGKTSFLAETIDEDYFASLVKGVQKNKEALEKSLNAYLKEGWQFDRFDGTLRALLLCASYELANNTEVDATVIVKEYVDLE